MDDGSSVPYFIRFGVWRRGQAHPEIVAGVVDCGDGLAFCVDEFAADVSSFSRIRFLLCLRPHTPSDERDRPYREPRFLPSEEPVSE